MNNQNPVQAILKVIEELDASIVTNNTMFALKEGNAEDIKRQLAVLQSESLELVRAITSEDPPEFYDGIGDCVYVIGSLIKLAPELALEFHAVRESFHIVSLALRGVQPDIWEDVITHSTTEAMKGNLTKFDTNEEDAKATQAAYAKLGVPTVIIELGDEMFVVQSTVTDTNADVVVGKILKSSSRYIRPDFDLVAETYPTVRWGNIV